MTSISIKRPQKPGAARRARSMRDLGEITRTDFLTHSQPATGPIRVVDLFCGAGGLSCGFEIVGRLESSFRLAGALDLDKHSVETYRQNLGLAPVHADLFELVRSGRKLSSLAERLNLCGSGPLVLIGGPPCQGFSAHRKREVSLTDERNNLVLCFARIAELFQPDVVVLENVPELLSHKHWKLFQAYRSRLERSGYRVRARVHDVAAFGAPQHRYRALVLASKKGLVFPAPVVAPNHYRTVRQAIGHLPSITPGDVCGHDSMHYCTNHRKSTIDTIRQVPKDGGSRPKGVGPRCLMGVDGYRDVYGRLYWDRPANTITNYARNPASGRFVHPDQNRGLSIREAALLQGFPPDFFFYGPFDDKFAQIGNAVPPVFAVHLAAHILDHLTDHPGRIADDDYEADVNKPLSNSFSSSIPFRKGYPFGAHRFNSTT